MNSRFPDYSVIPFPSEDGQEAQVNLSPVVMAETPSESTPGVNKYTLMNREALQSLVNMMWAIKHVFPRKGLTAIYGPSGSGKSFLAFCAAIAMAEGQAEWFGYRVTQVAAVIYIVLEGEGGYKHRVDAWEKKSGRNIPDNFYSLVNQSFSLITTDPADLARVINEQIPDGDKIVFIDTQNAAAPTVNENSPEGMGAIIQGAKTLQRLCDCLVVVITHTGKDTTRGPRGHSSEFAAMDSIIEVSRNGDQRAWASAKVKDGKDGAVHPFILETVDLGIDEDGDQITSCVIKADDSRPIHKGAVKTTVAERAVLKIIPASPGAAIDEVRSKYLQGVLTITPDAKRDSINKTFKRTIDSLIDKKLAIIYGSMITTGQTDISRHSPDLSATLPGQTGHISLECVRMSGVLADEVTTLSGEGFLFDGGADR